MHPVRAIVPLVLFMTLLAACGREEPGGNAGEASGGGVELDVSSPSYAVFQILRASGNRVEVKNSISQPFFEPKGTILSVNGNDVQVFEFGSSEEVAGAAAKVSADGSTVGSAPVKWTASPHFYKTQKVIAIYDGDDAATRNALETTLGPQFAGKP